MNLREELGLTTKTSSQDIETEKQDVGLGIREELGLAPIKKDQKKKRGFASQKLAQPEGFAEDYIGQVSPFMQTGQETPLGRLPKEEVPIDGAIEMLGGQEISKPVRFREPGFYSMRVTEEQDIESPFREDFKKSAVPEIRQGKEGDQATISGAIKKSIHHYINEFGAGMPGYVGEKILGEPVVEEAKGLEKIPVGVAGTAGFIGGLPGQLFKSVIKGITEVAPKLALKTGEGMTKRVLKGAAKEAPAFGIASMLSQTGEALKQNNLEDSLDVLGNAFAGGAVTGSIFAGSRGVWARDVKDRVMRMAVGLTLLNASRGTHPFDDRDLTDKIYESGIDAFFLWKGIPKEFIKSENKIAKEVKEQGLEKDLKIVTKEGVKKGTNIYEKLSTEAIERDAKIGVELAQIELARRIDKTKKAAKVEDDVPVELGEVKVVKAKTVSKDGKYLKETKKLKKEIGDEKYYEVLNSLGIEKANQVRGKKDKATVLKALKESKGKLKEVESKEPKEVKEVKEETIEEWIDKRTYPLTPISKVPLKFKTDRFKSEFEGDTEAVRDKWIKDKTHPLKPISKSKEFKTKKRATEFMEKEHSDGKFEVVKLGKAKWGLKPKEVEKVEGIPELTNTVEALAFGKRATPEQNKELKRLRNESEKKSEVLRKEFRATHSKEAGEAAQKEAVKGQFFREALEWKEGEKIMKEVRSNLGLEPIELGEPKPKPKPKSKPKSKTEPKKSKIVEASEELTYGEKFPTGNIKDVDAFREGITKDIKAFRKGAKIDIDKIEKDADRLLFSREYEDFKHEKDYESFTKSNDKLFDLIQKIKKEKDLKTFEKKIEDKPEKEMVLDSLGGQQIYEKSVKSLDKIVKKVKGRVIKTLNSSQTQILKDIMHLHTKDMIEADFTYSKGIMWKELGKEPKKKFDLNPQTSDTVKADTTNLKDVKDSSIKSIMFDPIFLVKGKRIKPTKSKMVSRFGGFKTIDDLWAYNKKSLSEFHRVLKPGGKLVVKTQDIIQKQAFFTSSEMYNHAVAAGFKPIDRFIYVRSSRMPLAPNIKEQKHARKAHVDFWVFEKPKISYKHPKESGISFDFMGGQQAYESLGRISRGIILEGKVKYGEFRTRMKEIVGKNWNSVKDFVRQAWIEAKESKGAPKETTFDSLGGQQIYDKVINRLSSKSGEQRKLTKEAIKKRDEKIGKATKVDLDDINQIGTAKGFSKSEIKKIADNTFGWKTKVENLSKEDADILKLKLAKLEPKEVLENEKLIYDNKSVLDSTKENFKKKVKLYDLDDAELSDYITISKGEKKSLNNSDVNNIISMIKTVNDIRADKGRVIWGYLAPAKRIFGEKFMVKWREATVKKLEHETPHILKTIRLVDDLKERSLKDITKYFEKGLSAKDLSPAELKAVKGIREVYNDLWGVFGIEKYIKSYSPRLPKFENRQDMIDWTFSRKGVKEFDFWAEHERTGELWNGELNAKKLLLRYIRTGFAKKFYGEALEKVKPIMSGMSKERRQMANKWIDTVIRKQPTAGEVVANRAIRKVLKTAGVKVDENKRYFKDLVGEALDLNYSAYMGLRPKLAMRNLTQQWLIANEYGYGSYLKGRTGKYQDSVKRALENSDVYKLRKKQYLVMEEKIDKISDIPSEIRQKMMWFYRMADLDNVETAFATGYLKAKSLHPNMTEGYAIRAGDKAVHNTQWGYGIDLPYMFKTPGGKFVGQYMSWPIWYLDHIGRIVKERHGAKAARTIVQAAVIGMIAKNTDFDYTRTVLLGAMPTALGYGPQSVLNFVKLVNSFGTWDSKKIEHASKEAGDIILGLVPGYLAAKDIKELGESGDVSKYLLYEKKKKKTKGGLKGL